ncbi:hypothetical protein QTN94_02135 [Vibrio sp. M250220]|uniref:hypothetical protein n=1 Tax=Vibrio sp. M250220 TaxID=3020894 RepID=UPI002F3ED6C5
MKNVITIAIVVCCSALLLGCANKPRLGHHVAKVKTQQTYNQNASQENLGVIPSGSGERMESAYQVYTGKRSSDLGGTDSQVLQGFAN